MFDASPPLDSISSSDAWKTLLNSPYDIKPCGEGGIECSGWTGDREESEDWDEDERRLKRRGERRGRMNLNKAL